MISDTYPALFQFFGCYFHPYWIEDYDTSENAINTYISEGSTDDLENAITELEKIANAVLNDSEIKSILSELGCYYDPNHDDTKTKDWLKNIKEKIESKSKENELI